MKAVLPCGETRYGAVGLRTFLIGWVLRFLGCFLCFPISALFALLNLLDCIAIRCPVNILLERSTLALLTRTGVMFRNL